MCVCEIEREGELLSVVFWWRDCHVWLTSVCMVICRWTVWWTFCPCCVTVQLNRRVQSSRTMSIDKQQSTQIQSSVMQVLKDGPKSIYDHNTHGKLGMQDWIMTCNISFIAKPKFCSIFSKKQKVLPRGWIGSKGRPKYTEKLNRPKRMK